MVIVVVVVVVVVVVIIMDVVDVRSIIANHSNAKIVIVMGSFSISQLGFGEV